MAENWEVEPAHLFAAEAVKAGRIGRINSFSISSVLFVSDEGNKYFETEWRKAPQVRGLTPCLSQVEADDGVCSTRVDTCSMPVW